MLSPSSSYQWKDVEVSTKEYKQRNKIIKKNLLCVKFFKNKISINIHTNWSQMTNEIIPKKITFIIYDTYSQ